MDGIRILEVSREVSDGKLAQLWQALQSPPLDGGLWNGRKVADWMSELLSSSGVAFLGDGTICEA